MIQQGWMKRLVTPVLTVFAVMAISYLGYFGSRSMDGGAVQQWMAAVFGTAYFFSIAFGTLYVYTMSYIRGACLLERIVASSINPFIWMTKEVLRLSESHPLVECLYWYANPLDIWLVSFMIMEMGMATLLGRFILKRSNSEIRVISTAPLAVIGVSFIFAVSVYAWGEGENVYVLFLKGYRALFGFGI